MVFSLVDTTERKKVEEDLQLLADQCQLALDAANLGWWHYDPLKKIAILDSRFGEVFGVTDNQCPNAEILKFLHPDDLPGVWAKVEAALDPSDPKPYHTEYRICRSDGSLRWIEAHGIAMFEGEGQSRHAASFVGTVQDITERKQAQNLLCESEQKYRTLVDSSPQGIFIQSRGCFAWLNPETVRLFGATSAEELLGKSVSEQFHPDERPKIRERIPVF